MKVYVASDHAGFELKTLIIPFVHSLGHEAVDMGPATLVENDDYPDYVIPLAHAVAADPESIGIIIGASGQGEAMAANRIKGARAGVFYGEARSSQTDAGGDILNLVQSMRAHNDANILSLGARFILDGDGQRAVRLFLNTPFSGDARHMRRIAKLDSDS